MKYLAAYTLLSLSGKSPTEADVTGLLQEVGIDVDAAAVKRVVDALKGKNLEDVIAEGSKKVQSLSFGGASQAAPAAKTVSAPVAEVKKEAPKKEEPKKEEEEDVGVGGFFDEF